MTSHQNFRQICVIMKLPASRRPVRLCPKLYHESGVIAVSRKENLATQVYQSLKKQIINNEILPNTYLDEKQICESLGVSRTPVREALVRLEWEGLVVSLPQRGVVVSDLSLQTIIELIHIRKVMEPELLKPYLRSYNRDVLLDFRAKMEQALRHSDVETLHALDYDFHKYLYEAGNRRHVSKLLSYVCDQSQRVRTQEFYLKQRSLSGAQDHIEIIDALLGGEYDRVPELLREHICRIEQYYHGILLSDVTST